MKKPIKLVWNAYNYRSFGQGLRVFNIFDHYSFMESVRKLLKKPMSKEEFSELLRREVLYYYWSKAEWELVITDTQPHIDSKELNRLITDCYLKRTIEEPHPLYSHVNLSDAEKIDVYEQVRLNWDEFVDYVWKFSKSETKRNAMMKASKCLNNSKK